MKYYRVFDEQTGRYFATGYNATSIKDLIKSFKRYIKNGGDDCNIRWLNSWCKIADYLQCVKLEKSNEPFEDYDTI